MGAAAARSLGRLNELAASLRVRVFWAGQQPRGDRLEKRASAAEKALPLGRVCSCAFARSLAWAYLACSA